MPSLTNENPVPLLPLSDRPLPRLWLGLTATAVALLYAALWSPHWYPLSDSSLYLRMAKGLAAGKPLYSVRQVHRSIRPIVPLLLSCIIRLGGGIGAMLAVMTACMLASLALAFLTLRQWLGERVAFWATLLTAISWWVFSSATTVMTEPTFLVFFWASLRVLTAVRRAATPAKQWALVLTGAALLFGAWANRVAAIFFVPGVALALALSTRDVAPLARRAAWFVTFALLGALMLADYYRPIPPNPQVERERGGFVADVGDTDQAERGYHWTLLLGVSNPLIQMPVNGGRWVEETVAAPLYAPFAGSAKSHSPAYLAGCLMAFTTMTLFVIGWGLAWRRGHYWPAAVTTYFLPLWIMWGTRVKPRYMVPIAPILCALLWAGLAYIITRLPRFAATRSGARSVPDETAPRFALALLLLISVPLNAFPYAVELYIRHTTRGDFYDLARRGWASPLVDVASYVRHHAAPDAAVWMNRGANRRIVTLLTDRKVMTIKGETQIKNPQDAKGLATTFQRLNDKGFADADYFLACYDEPAWPRFHWPLAHPQPDPPPQWWQLFARDPATKTFHPIPVPRDRTAADELLSPQRQQPERSARPTF